MCLCLSGHLTRSSVIFPSTCLFTPSSQRAEFGLSSPQYLNVACAQCDVMTLRTERQALPARVDQGKHQGQAVPFSHISHRR